MSLELDYFYGTEAEQYSFYRIPKTLFTDQRFKGVSMEAKVLYGLMLDRMGLSIRNGWLDKDGKVYIYFTLEDAVEMLNSGKDKVIRLFKELDKPNGIGLIERRKQGQGKPTRIYVMNFTLPPEPEQASPAEPPTPPVQTSEKPKSGLREGAEVLTSDIPKSRLLESRGQDFAISDPNKTDKNNTELSDTESSIHPPTPTPRSNTRRSRLRKDRMDRMDAYRALICQNIDYDLLLQEHPYEQDLIDGYVELMVEACCSGRETIRVNQEDTPVDLVRSRLLKLDKEHITYVMECLGKNTTLVGNIKAYTLSALYSTAQAMKNKSEERETDLNKKEIGELSRRWKPEKCAVSRIYGCYVGSGKRIVADLDESLGRMTQEEAEFYLGFLKKVLSGAQGRNLIDIVFSTSQVAESDEHRLLMDLKKSELQNGEARRMFYQKVIGCLEMDEESYLILMASDSYDVPHRGKDDERQDDASDEVFTYFLCAVCPVKEGKLSLDYFPGDNEFHCSDGHTVAPPELGFLFPAFDDRAANIYNALFYARKPDQLHQEFIDAIFHTEPPLSAAEQRENFQAALTETLGDACGLEVVQAIHEQLTEKLAQHKESKDPEPLSLTAKDVGRMLRECGVQEEQAVAFEDQCAVSLGEGTALNPANLVDTGRFEVKTAVARLIVDPACSYVVETRVIDGKRYILIPAGEEVEVNGIPAHVKENGES